MDGGVALHAPGTPRRLRMVLIESACPSTVPHERSCGFGHGIDVDKLVMTVLVILSGAGLRTIRTDAITAEVRASTASA